MAVTSFVTVLVAMVEFKPLERPGVSIVHKSCFDKSNWSYIVTVLLYNYALVFNVEKNVNIALSV